MKIVWTLSSIPEISEKSASERYAIWNEFWRSIRWPQRAIYYLSYGVGVIIALVITSGLNFLLFASFRDESWYFADWFNGARGVILGLTSTLGLVIGSISYRSVYYSRFRSEFVRSLSCRGEMGEVKVASDIS